MPTPIDWSKPHLRIAYLVEGQLRDRARQPQLVRWCGPKSRTGSGLSARSSGAAGGFQRAFEPGFQQYEARLSKCSFDKTLGSLKQSIQALSQITFTVDIGEEDLPESGEGAQWDTFALRNLVLYGRWRGHLARFIVADLDDLDSYEIMGEGTWDRDPTSVTAYTFKMTIDVGQAIPPTLPWPMWQVPAEVPGDWEATVGNWNAGETLAVITASRRAPLEYGFQEGMEGKFVGQVFGGAPGILDVWRELAHYGEDPRSTTSLTYDYHYCLISPEFDQFVFDVVYEDEDGDLYQVSDETTPYIFVWNNTNSRFGPIGTVCKFATDTAMDSLSGRIWGKVGGGPGFVSHGPNYTGHISYQDFNGTLLGQGLTSAGAIPDVYGTNLYGEPHLIFKWIIEDVCGGELHPDAISDLLTFAVTALPQVNGWNRACAIPPEINMETVSVSKVLEDLMFTIPADLILKRDATDPEFRRKYYAVPRPRIIDDPIVTFKESDLVDTVPPLASVKHLSDPDGIYSNDTTVTTDDYFQEPDVTENMEPRPTKRLLELVDVTEQASEGTGQVIEGEIAFHSWNWASKRGFRAVSALLERARSRPQPVIEAQHGYPSYRYELGDLIRYEIDGAFRGPGQIRMMRLDLDRQTVTMRSYHMADLPRAVAWVEEIDLKDKGQIEAKGVRPVIDRIPWAKVMPD